MPARVQINKAGATRPTVVPIRLRADNQRPFGRKPKRLWREQHGTAGNRRHFFTLNSTAIHSVLESRLWTLCCGFRLARFNTFTPCGGSAIQFGEKNCGLVPDSPWRIRERQHCADARPPVGNFHHRTGWCECLGTMTFQVENHGLDVIEFLLYVNMRGHSCGALKYRFFIRRARRLRCPVGSLAPVSGEAAPVVMVQMFE